MSSPVRNHKLVQLQRAFKLTGAPFILPPGTPKDRVEILKEAFRKIYRDPEFHKKHQKLTGEEPTPLMPEDHERAIREIPREPEVIELFKKLVGASPLPPH
jgi:tripartite-type tricarboxylate transporter receptor subunit TctC